MNRQTWNSDHGSLKGIYRDRERGWFFGVCAGVADFFGFRTGSVRLLTAVSLLLFFWPTALLYLAAVFLFRERPLIYSGRRAEDEFWRRSDYREHWSHR